MSQNRFRKCHMSDTNFEITEMSLHRTKMSSPRRKTLSGIIIAHTGYQSNHICYQSKSKLLMMMSYYRWRPFDSARPKVNRDSSSSCYLKSEMTSEIIIRFQHTNWAEREKECVTVNCRNLNMFEFHHR